MRVGSLVDVKASRYDVSVSVAIFLANQEQCRICFDEYNHPLVWRIHHQIKKVLLSLSRNTQTLRNICFLFIFHANFGLILSGLPSFAMLALVASYHRKPIVCYTKYFMSFGCAFSAFPAW